MKMRLAAVMLLAAVTLGIYLPTVNHDFVHYDDNRAVFENPRVKDGFTPESIRWAFNTTFAANWHPVTWLSHMLDAQLFGLWPGGHHLTSTLLHTANTILLLLVLHAMTGCFWPSLLTAALFGLHPLHAESVAWVAERKDVLSTFFWMLAMGAWLRYLKRPGAVRYAVVTACFALGLMSKPMPVTLPFVLLLLDYWPLGRLGVPPVARAVPGTQVIPPWRLVAEKAPLFVLSLLSSVVAYIAQAQGDALMLTEILPFRARLSNALLSYVRYLGKMIWPAKLSVLYLHPGRGIPLWMAAAAFIFLAAVTVAAVRARRRAPYLPVGWFWYLGTLVPVIGLVQVGMQSMADRYTYVPSIGIFMLAAWGSAGLAARWRALRGGVAAAWTVVAVLLAAATWPQVGYWKNTESLMRHSIKVTHGNFVSSFILGVYFDRSGNSNAAIPAYRESLKTWPRDTDSLFNLGRDLARTGDVDGAIDAYAKLVAIDPRDTGALHELADLLASRGRVPEAIDRYREVVAVDPDNLDARDQLAKYLLSQGMAGDAIDHLAACVALAPEDAKSYYNLGKALDAAGRMAEAVENYRQALKLAPSFAPAHNNLGAALAQSGDLDGAIREFREALRTDPGNAEAAFNLSRALEHKGN